MDTNGVISAYEICWKIKNSTDELNCPSKKSSRADREYTIRKLKPGTIYIVTVKASTSAGYGPEDKKENGTVKSGKLTAVIYKCTTQLEISSYYV